MEMVRDVYFGKTLRKSYSKHDEILEIPNLLRIQKDSYEWFLREGDVYKRQDVINYRQGDIVEQIMDKTGGKGVDRVIIAGGTAEETFGQAIKMLKPGGRIGNVNYLGSGENVLIPRVEWGCGMGHKTIAGGLIDVYKRQVEIVPFPVAYDGLVAGLQPQYPRMGGIFSG